MSRSVRVAVAELGPGERVLDEESSHYLARVLRLPVGARFVAFDAGRAVEADAELVAFDAGHARILVAQTRPARVVATRELVWVHCLSKGDKLDDIVRDATELGATRIVVAESARSVVHLDAARVTARRARWTKIAREAARQSGRGDPPEIVGPLAWTDALASVPSDAARFCLHTGGAPPLGPSLAHAIAAGRALGFAAGPEGGLTVDEVASAEAAGFTTASLGPFVLRTETVAAAVLGACRILAAEPLG